MFLSFSVGGLKQTGQQGFVLWFYRRSNTGSEVEVLGPTTGLFVHLQEDPDVPLKPPLSFSV